jgi:hypothetical protein
MSSEARKALFVISAVAVISTTASLWFFIEKEEAKQSYQELERTLGLENSFLKRTLSEVSTERDRLKTKADQLNDEIIQAKQEKLSAVAKFNTAVQVQKELEGRIAALQGEKQIFEAQINHQKLRIAHLQGRVLTASSSQFAERKTVESLQKELERIKEDRSALEQKLESQGQRIEPIGRAVELPPIMIGSPAVGFQTPLLNVTPSLPIPTTPSPGMTVAAEDLTIPNGKILTVNEDHQFVVIGLGEKDGVMPGMKFKVLRGGEEVGAVEVIETRPNIAAADIKETRTARLQSDDQVLLSQR